MSISTPLGNTLNEVLENLFLGKSAITKLDPHLSSEIDCKITGNLLSYDFDSEIKCLEKNIPEQTYLKMNKFLKIAPWSTCISSLLGVKAWNDAGLFDYCIPPEKIGSIAAGHNINMGYIFKNDAQFKTTPHFIDPFYSLHVLDTDHAATISELIQARGATYTSGSACASGNTALRSAIDEIRYHNLKVAIVTGPVFDYSQVVLHSLALMGAISTKKFNDTPSKASRPFDRDREGFVPSHGGGALVIESLDCALNRGARIYAEIIGVEVTSDASHLPQPSENGQIAVLKKIFKKTKVYPEQIDFISAHATSTPLGDLTEVRAIQKFFGTHTKKIKINAPKSLLGHTLWSSAIVETIVAILQMKAGKLHPSINIENLDPKIDLDICTHTETHHPINYLLKNSFGFGGINSACIIRSELAI